MSGSRPFILDYDHSDLTEVITSWGLPPYRANQIWHGLYRNLWSDPQEFTPLPQALRERLDHEFRFSHLNTRLTVQSRDGQSTKTLFDVLGGHAIEAVLMVYEKRRTLCISTQAGCAMGCVFCATGQMGFRVNLSSGEIVEQVLYYARALAAEGQRPTNIVVMGMGEPFHNYEATMAALDRLNHPEGFNMGARRFTISTVGLIPMIQRFTKERRQFNLAVSLHATDDELRSSMLPINRKYPIEALLSACREYVEATGRRITFEWALIEAVNDTPEQARSLAQRLNGLLCHVNIIPLNPTRGYSGSPTTHQRALAFKNVLESRNISCTVRVRRGIDIDAGCGQLAVQGPETGGHQENHSQDNQRSIN